MFTEVLSEKLQKCLALLGKTPEIKPFYLAGGTGLALHLGHRVSFDLDFYTPESFDNRKLMEALSKMGNLAVEQRLKDTFMGSLGNAKISFFKYAYPLLAEPKDFVGVRIAGISDIACMKLEAVGSRGIKRDFVDLYEICRTKFSLEQVFELFQKKYGGVKFSLVHLARSLTYFEDAEESEMPKMLKEIKWSEVKKFFEQEAVKLSRKLF